LENSKSGWLLDIKNFFDCCDVLQIAFDHHFFRCWGFGWLVGEELELNGVGVEMRRSLLIGRKWSLTFSIQSF
jgi:hypothetical protein